MRPITRIFHGFDSVANERWTDTNEVLYIGNKIIVRKDETAVTFEQVPHLKEGAESVEISYDDRNVKVFHLDMFPELKSIKLTDLLTMTVMGMVEVIFERMGVTE